MKNPKLEEMKHNHNDEEAEVKINQSSVDAIIKGNKQLSVEVKLCDLIRFGGLG